MPYLNDPKAEEFKTGILITESDWELDGHEFNKMLEAKIQLVRQELLMRAIHEYDKRQSPMKRVLRWWDNLAINSGQW